MNGSALDVTFSDKDVDVSKSEDSEGHQKLRCKKFKLRRVNSAMLFEHVADDFDDEDYEDDNDVEAPRPGQEHTDVDLDISAINFDKYEKQSNDDNMDCYFSNDVFLEIRIGDNVIVSTETPF